MKKTLIITTLLVVLIASQVSAFELVNQKPTSKKFCLGGEVGVISNFYYAISGNYNVNEQVTIQALVGQMAAEDSEEESSSNEDEANLLVAGKGIYRLTNNLDYDYYLFGLAGKINEEIDAGAGVGVEFNTLSLPNNVRYQAEAGYTINNSALLNAGIKLYF